MNDRLYRSRDERILAGVAGGFAERFDVDPSLVRVLWVVLVFVTGGLFLLVYIAMALIVPEAPYSGDRWAGWAAASAGAPGAVAGWGQPGPTAQTFSGQTPEGGASADPSTEGATGGLPGGTAGSAGGPAGPGGMPGGTAGASPAGGPSGAGPGSGPPPGWGSPTWQDAGRRHRHREHRGDGAIIGGIVLILLGSYFLLRTVAPEIDLGAFWPVVLIIVGVALLFGSIRPGRGPADRPGPGPG